MARLPRLTLAGLPHHIIQRGNNGAEIFVDTADCSYMLDLLREMARRFGVDIHAYVLLPDQFQLLVTPETDATPEGRRLIEAGLSRVAAVRQAAAAAGTGIHLYVDCHWRFSAATAAVVLRELADLGVVWFECPLPETAANMGALRRLRGQANARGVRLAGLEELTHAEAFRPWLEAGCYDVVMPDVKYAGGIGGVLKVAELAAGFNTACAPHNPTGPVCHAASLVACALGPNMEMLEHQFDETPNFWDIVDGDLPQPLGGISRLPQGDGLGVALRRSALVD